MLQRPRLILPRLLLLGAFATLVAAPLGGQTAATDANGQFVFKANARTVVIDVVVTGGGGKPVQDLQKKDFLVAEDGHPQNITYFEEHTGAKAADPSRHRASAAQRFQHVPAPRAPATR